ncbi:PLP-dependent aminotransferase family protein [Pseudonocardia broussonetiae]|uniref:PLP-dependent aminotransferase family protein n=1 Tax=Pseudonocardia broussonetiae TaxID=2736640 RepID=A0A6M6JM30_9PSEU|nr:PLP-dependent aminotransferase family protein [Pseudonocardia broussonetiae]QJY48436.1 PLP-dependent aminotransferase family protein [Pseudonocardia broussonetiae]
MHLSTATRSVRGSAIRDLLALTARPEVISLAGGLPAAELMPRARIAEAAAKALTDPRSVQYGETAGLPALRAVLAAHETGRCGREVADVVVTTGSQQALDLVARALLDAGDDVVVEEPAYVGALQVFQAAGARLHPVGLDADGMRVDDLERHLRDGLRPRLVHTVASFHNPRGVTLSAPRRVRLAELAERYGFVVVEDDPYGLLAFDGAPPVPVAAHSDRVVRLGSASKVLAPALRVGWLSGPPEVLAAVELLKQCTDLCTSSLTQAVAAELVADAAWFDAHLAGVRDATAARARAFTAAVAEHLPGARCSVPTGGMFCWLDLPGVDTTALLPRALEAGVGFVPGSAFAVAEPAPSSLRCCYASHPEGVVDEAVRRLARAAT